MTNELFESLLFEEEGTTIDFKKEQYRFAKTSDDERSELVKDILGFANAWRRTKAYILVGVEEVRGGKSTVAGINASAHLDDHSLQQFVNSLVNTPVRFQYRAFSYQGKQVGIFVLDEGQQRPIYLTRNFGKLEKEKVYVRRGSSTDPSKPASPTEIAQMGTGRPRESAELLVEFAQVSGDDAIGARLHIECELCNLPEGKDIPTLRDPRDGPYGIHIDPTTIHNSNYYRELAEYEFLTRLCRGVRITVKNIGEAPATNVRVELVVPMGMGVLPRRNLPNKPQRTWMLGERMNIHSIQRRDPGEVEIDKNTERFRIVIDCQDLQPGRRVWSDRFYIGAAPTGEYQINGEVLADTLPAPQPFTLTIVATVEETTINLKELMQM